MWITRNLILEKLFDMPNMALMNDEQICREIGVRLRAERIRRDLTQAEMSDLSGIPLRTYKRLEANGAGSIETFIAALRAFDRLIGLQLLLPQPTLVERRNPLTTLTAQRMQRKKSRIQSKNV